MQTVQRCIRTRRELRPELRMQRLSRVSGDAVLAQQKSRSETGDAASL
jgi:hypothetical protein